MRPIIEAIDIPGDTEDKIMARSGAVVGFGSNGYVIRYGFLPGSDEAKVHGCHISTFIWARYNLAGKIEEQIEGFAFNLPKSFLNIINDPMRVIEKPNENELEYMAQELSKQSKDICEANGCPEDEHNCESYAYFDIKKNKFGDIISFSLGDICSSDYAQKTYDIAIPLPFDGDGAALLEALYENDSSE